MQACEYFQDASNNRQMQNEARFGLALTHLYAGDLEAARGLAGADKLLECCRQNVSVLDTKGLALCGLALCEDEGHLTPAGEAFDAARKITQAKGVVARVLSQFDALALADTDGKQQKASEVTQTLSGIDDQSRFGGIIP